MGIREVVSRTPALAGVSSASLERLVAVARCRTVERGGYLWHAGDPADSLTLIRAGLVKVVKSNQKGRRAICGLFGAPDTVGDAAVLRGIPYPADVLVASPSASLIELPRRDVMTALSMSPIWVCRAPKPYRTSSRRCSIRLISCPRVQSKLVSPHSCST